MKCWQCVTCGRALAIDIKRIGSEPSISYHHRIENSRLIYGPVNGEILVTKWLKFTFGATPRRAEEAAVEIK